MRSDNLTNAPLLIHVFIDAKKQSQMSQLSKQRDNLQKVINTYHSLFDTTDLLTKELQSKHIGTSPHLVVHVHINTVKHG